MGSSSCQDLPFCAIHTTLYFMIIILIEIGRHNKKRDSESDCERGSLV